MIAIGLNIIVTVLLSLRIIQFSSKFSIWLLTRYTYQPVE